MISCVHTISFIAKNILSLFKGHLPITERDGRMKNKLINLGPPVSG